VLFATIQLLVVDVIGSEICERNAVARDQAALNALTAAGR